MYKYLQYFLLIPPLLLLLLVQSCKNRQESKEAKPPIPSMVDLPLFISDQIRAHSYLAQHYWDNTDITDTLYLQNPKELRGFFLSYLQHLWSGDSLIAAQSLKSWTKKVLQSPQNMQEHLLNLAENTLYNPNSPIRNETLYISMLEILSADSSLTPLIRQRYAEQLYIAKQNRPGERANNFKMVDSKGKELFLNHFIGRYTLIMFYEPNCPSCEASLDFLNSNEIFAKASKAFNLLAVYTGENIEEWKKSINNFKPVWRVAHDLEMDIITNRLYDRRPSPSFYLLDKSHIVLLKDGTATQLISMLEQLKSDD